MVEIIVGTPLANAVRQAEEALQVGEYDRAATHYQEALAQLSGGTALAADLHKAIWVEHVGGLLQREQFNLAINQAEVYIDTAQAMEYQSAELELLVLLAEALAAQDKWKECEQILAGITRRLENISTLGDRMPHFVRLQGLLAAEKDNPPLAHLLLIEAVEGFVKINHHSGRRTVVNDLYRLKLVSGNARVFDETPNWQDIRNTTELLLLARAMRRAACYETAARFIEAWLEREVEPVLRFPLLHELALLCQILSAHEKVQQLLPSLEQAAQIAADPPEAKAAISRLKSWREQGFIDSKGASFEARLATIRALVQNGELKHAEDLLTQLSPEAKTVRFAAYCSLVSGELAFAQGLASNPDQVDRFVDQALTHLAHAEQLARDSLLFDVSAQSLRLIGRVYARLRGETEIGGTYWARADRIEELIAHRQETDSTRIRYLASIPSQYDEIIEATAARVTAPKGELLASVIVAMESARGAAILPLILPLEAAKMRELPLPDQPQACLSWYHQIAAELPQNMAVWLLHMTTDRIHHGLVGRDLLQWASIKSDRCQLSDVIDQLNECWELSPQQLEEQVEEDPDYIPGLLREIADLLQPELVLSGLPKRITRLAVVAGDVLADVPFAALPFPNADSPNSPLIIRYALSDLPCLSALAPLARRAASARGDYGLIVQPPAVGIPTVFPARNKHIEWLKGDEATIEELVHLLSNRSFSWLRIDTHGKHEHTDPLNSYLKLSSARGNEDRLTARRFQEELTLKGCGTLILGACETGMAQRRGRDERIGFVRAGFAAGATAVLASRWIAKEAPTSGILNRFQGYLRYLPRDQALQRAQLEVMQEPRQASSSCDGSHPYHPARWACWTLYGDAGLQTSASWPVRLLRNTSNKYRHTGRM